ncbi:MAG TPA: type II toxin-antitoxin system Phd/YefM family antitoxin [Gemmatimonadota bacterium]|nr:type II toxin-antitoxin system Phd/YefM family antitoxin [Gemmatimonadota bacterium]
MASETISVTKARERLTALVDEVSQQLSQYTILKHGEARAVLLAAQEYEALLETLDILSDSKAVARIRASLDELSRGESLSFEDVTGEPL